MAFLISDVSRNIVVIGLLPPIDTSSDVLRDSRQIQQNIAGLLCGIDTNIWCVYDFSDVELRFDDLVMMFIDQSRKKPGSFSDRRVHIVGVVNDQALAEKLNIFLDRYKWEMPLFDRFDDAIGYVNQQIDVNKYPVI